MLTEVLQSFNHIAKGTPFTMGSPGLVMILLKSIQGNDDSIKVILNKASLSLIKISVAQRLKLGDQTQP